MRAATQKLKDKGVEVMFSYDSARIHTSAMKLVDSATGKLVMASYGFKDSQRFPLPPYSPDMHRVIERTHGSAVIMFEKWLYQNPKKCSIQRYKEVFESIYRECCCADAIAADVAGLPELYEWIYSHEGNWAPKRMR